MVAVVRAVAAPRATNGGAAQEVGLEARVAELAGQRVLYSSPYLRGDEAVEIEVQQAQVSDDFVDDGLIVLNGVEYPLDQIFMQNNEGRLENLASLYAYNGVAGTFLLRYYDKERLAVANEKAKLLADVDRCVQPFEFGGADGVYRESKAQSACIDEVFQRFVKLFYSFSEEEILADYQAMVELWDKSFEALAAADFCYGRCGTAAMMSAAGKAVEMQAAFVHEAIETVAAPQAVAN